MTNITIAMSSKGGIGKTVMMGYFGEHRQQYNSGTICIDLDPQNKTFCQYKSLNVMPIDIKNNKNEIDSAKFDALIELILENADKDIVIDAGSNIFVALGNYINDNQIIEYFQEENIELTILVIVAGGGNAYDSLVSFDDIVDNFDTNYILVNNQLLGSTSVEGVKLYDTLVYEKAKKNIIGIVEIDEKPDYISKDIISMTQDRLTFSELLASPNFNTMQKRRLLKYRDEIWYQFDKIFEQ